MRLLEVAQVPKEHVEEFKSVKKFKIFNSACGSCGERNVVLILPHGSQQHLDEPQGDQADPRQ